MLYYDRGIKKYRLNLPDKQDDPSELITKPVNPEISEEMFPIYAALRKASETALTSEEWAELCAKFEKIEP